jgi:hypothetical protein
MIEEYIKENSKQLSSINETDMHEQEREVNEITPVIKHSTTEVIVEQQEK